LSLFIKVDCFHSDNILCNF